MLIDAGLNRLRKLYHHLLDDGVKDRGQVAHVTILLDAVSWGCIATWCMMRIHTDCVIRAGFLPFDINQLGFSFNRNKIERICTHLLVDYLFGFGTYCFSNLIAFFFLLDDQTVLHILLLAISLECGHTHLSLFFHIVNGTFLSFILDTRTVRPRWCMVSRLMVGRSCLMVMYIRAW